MLVTIMDLLLISGIIPTSSDLYPVSLHLFLLSFFLPRRAVTVFTDLHPLSWAGYFLSSRYERGISIPLVILHSGETHNLKWRRRRKEKRGLATGQAGDKYNKQDYAPNVPSQLYFLGGATLLISNEFNSIWPIYSPSIPLRVSLRHRRFFFFL